MGFDSYIALRQTRYESDDKNNFIYSYNIFVKTTPNEKKKKILSNIHRHASFLLQIIRAWGKMPKMLNLPKLTRSRF